jgi:CheY-like chemotaxis protein
MSNTAFPTFPVIQSVLIAEDHRRQRAEIVKHVGELGLATVHEAATAHEAIRLAVEHRPQLILLDGLLPGMHGFEVARIIRAIDPAYQPRIVLITAIYKNIRYENEAKLKFGVDAYLIKPVTPDAIRGAIEGAEVQAA